MQQKETFTTASVDEVDAEEMQNQTTKDVIRKSSVSVSDICWVSKCCM